MSYDDFNDHDEYDAEDDEFLEELYMMGELDDETDQGGRVRGGGCLTSVLTVLAILVVIIMAFSLFGCGKKGQIMDGDGMVYTPAYAQISQDEARLMMKNDDGHVVVDVRRADEYAQGHIPGAILIPNEEIGTEEPKELPDKNQIILVYCRTGRRSKEASQKLADMGYVNVYEFGGIEDWTGEIVHTDNHRRTHRVARAVCS